MVCSASAVVRTRLMIRLTKTTENSDSTGISSKAVASHCILKKNGAESMISATDRVIVMTTNEMSEMMTEMSVQAVIFALNTLLVLIDESIRVSRVPLSRSLTNAQAADATEQTIGTHKNSSGHSSVVKASSQNAR